MILSLHRYLKPSADSLGSHSNLGLHPDPSSESARAVVAAANKEVVAVLSGTTTIYYNTCFTCTNHEIITLLTYYCAVLVCTSKEIVKLKIR